MGDGVIIPGALERSYLSQYCQGVWLDGRGPELKVISEIRRHIMLSDE